jgi:hypothetical protein
MGINGGDSSGVSKSNWVHVDIFQVFFIKMKSECFINLSNRLVIITLSTYITMLSRTDNIPQNIHGCFPHLD